MFSADEHLVVETLGVEVPLWEVFEVVGPGEAAGE